MVRSRLHQVPLRPGQDGGVQSSGARGAREQAGTVGLVTAILVAGEGLLAAAPPLGNVVRQSRDDDSCQSGYDRRLSAANGRSRNGTLTRSRIPGRVASSVRCRPHGALTAQGARGMTGRTAPSPHAHNPGTTPGTCLSTRPEAIQARRQDHGPSNLGTWFRRLIVTAS